MLRLRKQKTAAVEIAGEGGIYRFTFARVSGMGDMRYQFYRSVANKFVKAQTGQDIEKIVGALRTDNADPNLLAFALAAMAYPRITASLQSIHLLPADADPANADNWQEQPIPDEWRDIEQFFDAIDRPEIALLDDAASECNRDLWFVSAADTAKKKEPKSGK